MPDDADTSSCGPGNKHASAYIDASAAYIHGHTCAAHTDACATYIHGHTYPSDPDAAATYGDAYSHSSAQC